MNRLIIFILTISISSQVIASNTLSNAIEPVTYFTNQKLHLSKIATNLETYKKTSLIGISGIGKTQLARMYAKIYRDKYEVIWFIDCNQDLNQEFLSLARAVNKLYGANIPENISSAQRDVMYYLSNKGKWLLVFDNLKVSTNNKVRSLVEWDNNGHVIFCAQDSHLLPDVIHVTPLTKQDVVSLSSKILETNDMQYSHILYKEFNGYPILIAQGSKLMKEIRGLTAQEYETKLSNSNDKIKSNIEIAISALSPSARNLLFRISLINNLNFSKNLLRIIAPSKEKLDDDLYQLSKFAIIYCIDPNGDNPIFEMHNIIAKNLRKINGGNANKRELSSIIQQISDALPEGAYKSHLFMREVTIRENLDVITQNETALYANLKIMPTLERFLLGYYLNSMDFYNAKKIISQFEENDKKNIFKLSSMTNHEKRLYASHLNLIGTYNRKRFSDHNLALYYYNRASEIYKNLDCCEAERFNLAYVSASSYISIGEILDAQRNINIMKDIAQSGKIGQEDLTLLRRISAKIYYYQGSFAEALKEINESIDVIISKGVNKLDPVLISPYLFKSLILNSLHKYQEGYMQTEELQKIYKSLNQKDLRMQGRILAQKAKAELGLSGKRPFLDPDIKKLKENNDVKRVNSALGMINQALFMLLSDRGNKKNDKIYRDEELAEIYVVQGDILLIMGNMNEAIESYSKSQLIYFHLFKDKTKDVEFVSDLFARGAKASCRMHDQFHYSSFAGAQIKDFGIDHPNTINILNYCKPSNMAIHLQDD